MDLLRFSTAGSVDDGKSTLIGRLLYETKAVFQDQIEELERVSRKRGGPLDLALLTDGLRAEREQGITIDVAYRYFATPKRKFIVADTPGHAQYTRNMVTGTSTADAALVLVDAARGLTEQSRRHLFVSALVRVPRIAVCINKMDLVDFDPAVFERLRNEVLEFSTRLGLDSLVFIPISALYGDNVVTLSPRMPWYEGPALLPYLENVDAIADDETLGARLPVQLVNRPQVGATNLHRGYAGQITGGVFRTGDAVIVMPAGLRTSIHAIGTFDGPLDEAGPPLSVVVTLEHDLDVARGDLICAAAAPVSVGCEIEATICWMSQTPLRLDGRYAIKHTTRSGRAVIRALLFRVDVNTLAEETGVTSLALNEIARVALRTTTPLLTDPYRQNRITGSFILIDERTNETVAAGMVAG